MSTQEVFEQITKPKKWYNGNNDVGLYCTQQAASALMKRYVDGTISHQKLIHLFTHFGYTQNTVTWVKIQ